MTKKKAPQKRVVVLKKSPNHVRRDPDFMREIGARGGRKTKHRYGKEYFSEMAKRSHPKNNPKVKRKYVGGRPSDWRDPKE